MNNLLKIFFTFVCLIFVLSLVACDNEGGTNGKNKIEEIDNYVKETVKVNVTEDLYLPTTHPTLGGTITWLSSDADYLLDDGTIVDRGRSKSVDVALGYIITLNGETRAGEITVHIAPITLEDAAKRFETCLPSKKNEAGETVYFAWRDLDFVSDYYGVITVDVTSSNPDLLANDGKYTKPLDDTDINLKVIVSDSFNSITNEYTITCQGRTALEVCEDATKWLEDNFTDLMLTEKDGLPTEIPEYKATITWASTNEDIVTSDGKVTETIFERFVCLTARVKFNEAVKTSQFYCKVKAKDSSNMTEQEKLEEYIKVLTPSTTKRMNFQAYGNITQSYGLLYLFTTDELTIKQSILPDDSKNKSNANRVSTQFVTVHDTANNSKGADEEMHARYIYNCAVSGEREASWHYSVGDDQIIQHVKIDEIAWHAGDGSRLYSLSDTGVKATKGMPSQSISEDGYFVLGGEKTKIKIPSDTKNRVSGPYGIYTEVGPNGNYWMNACHYDSTYGAIGNNGGNRNSVSMETCVDAGCDYIKTFLNAARLTVMILRHYNLSVDRVLQHNNFSGKPCPNAIRQAGEWANFRDLCSIIKYGLDTFGDYTFNWTPGDTSKMSNSGVIALSCSKGDKLNYALSVKKNNIEVYSNNFTVTLA